jgi:hypothetical protein
MCKSRNKNVEDHKKRGKPHVKMVESRAKRRITHSKMRTLGFVPFLMWQGGARAAVMVEPGKALFVAFGVIDHYTEAGQIGTLSHHAGGWGWVSTLPPVVTREGGQESRGWRQHIIKLL